MFVLLLVVFDVYCMYLSFHFFVCLFKFEAYFIFIAKFAGPCEPMAPLFKRLKLDFGDVTFVQAVTDNISSLVGFRGQSCPAFLFFYVINYSDTKASSSL